MDLAVSPATASATANPITAVTYKSAGFSIAAADVGSVFECAGTFFIDLPAGATAGSTFYVWIRNNSGVQTIRASGAETIGLQDASLDLILNNIGDYVLLVCAGGTPSTANWLPFHFNLYQMMAYGFTADTVLTTTHSLALADSTNVKMKTMTVGNFKKESGFHCNRNAVNQAAVATSTWTKVAYTTEEFDVFNELSVTTGATGQGRFTPLYAGKYLVFAQATFSQVAEGAAARSSIYKNGSDIKQQIVYSGNLGADNLAPQATAIVDMNGSTDYLEHYALHTHGSDRTILGDTNATFFTSMKLGT